MHQQPEISFYAKFFSGTCPVSSNSFAIGIQLKNSIKIKTRKRMDEFMLIFRHQDGKEVASPEQIQDWMKQTMDWIGGIAAQNKFVEGNGLPFEDAHVVGHKGVVTNGPFGDIKETIAGYIMVRA